MRPILNLYKSEPWQFLLQMFNSFRAKVAEHLYDNWTDCLRVMAQKIKIDLIRTFSWVEIYVCRRRGNAAKFNTAIKLNCKRSIHSHYVWLPRNLHVKNTLFSGYFCGVCVLAKDFQISFFEAVFFSQCLAVMKFPKENDSILFIFIENFPSF